MCCSATPGVEVRFSDTVLYAAEVLDAGGELAHVLGYQNHVRGSVGALSWLRRWLPFGHTGNAMILPFPAVPGTMTRANVLDTSGCRDVLQDMARALRPKLSGMLRAGGSMFGKSLRSVEVFSTGIYTVVLARDAADIPSALAQVPRRRRPRLNPALFDAYSRWYPGWTVALCCFDGRDAALADPMLWWYRPTRPDRLFLPALDGHTGDVPDLAANVLVDHVLAVGSYRMRGGEEVAYTNEVPERVRPYLTPRVVGGPRNNLLPNGDFWCRVAGLAREEFEVRRERPPGAAA